MSSVPFRLSWWRYACGDSALHSSSGVRVVAFAPGRAQLRRAKESAPSREAICEGPGRSSAHGFNGARRGADSCSLARAEPSPRICKSIHHRACARSRDFACSALPPDHISVHARRFYEDPQPHPALPPLQHGRSHRQVWCTAVSGEGWNHKNLRAKLVSTVPCASFRVGGSRGRLAEDPRIPRRVPG